MIDLGTPGTLESILARFDQRAAVPTVLSSEEISNLPLAIRETAVFSAKLSNLRTIQKIQEELAAQLALVEKEGGNGKAALNRSKFIEKVREVAIAEGLGSEPGEKRPIEDITSDARLKLIWEMNIRAAQGYADYVAGQDADVIDFFPAQELIRVESRIEPRPWPRIWQAAGGELYEGGRMIAAKSDPVWRSISRFDRPWPPFDFNSGMGLQDIDRDEAEELGVIEPDEEVKPSLPDFREELELDVSRMPVGLREAAEKLFGAEAVDRGGRMVIKGGGK